jgi:Osmosensitive K+ channel histidine kinase
MEAKIHTSALEESAIIERVARIVFSVRGAKPDYARLAGELEQVVPFDLFGVVLLRHDRQAARVTVCQREEDLWVAHLHQRPLADSMLERVLQQPALQVKDYPAGLDGLPADCGDALSPYNYLRSTLIAPLIVEDRVLGSLELGSTVPGTYSDQNLQRMMSAFTRVLATAIESVQLGGNAAIQDRQRQALKDVTSALTEKKDLATVLRHIVTGVSDALKVSSFLCLLDQRTNLLHLIASAGLEQEALEYLFQPGSQISKKSIIWQTIKCRQPLVSADLVNDERYVEQSILTARLGLRSIYCYPLLAESAIYGVLILCSTELGGFTPLKTDILTLFADQATVAIHNDILLAEARQRSSMQRAIAHFEQLLSQEEDTLTPEQEQEQLQLLHQLRNQVRQTLGISLSSMLNYVGTVLPTSQERATHTVSTIAEAAVPYVQRSGTVDKPLYSWPLPATDLDLQLQATSAETMALLERTADSALSNAAMLGELNRLITQLKQSANWVKDAWFVVDINGVCRYMNPVAQRLCKVNQEAITAYHHTLWELSQEQAFALRLEDVFAQLLPRIRNSTEVRGYLSAFMRECDFVRELRCIVSEEPVGMQTAEQESKTDHYYKLTRYPLYIEQGGQLQANALQMQNITEQVRDEKNRSALFSAVSHDLRTPLTTIKAAVTGLLEFDVICDAQGRREVLEEIDSEADHLTVLVTSLVELSRIEVGALDLKKESCDIEEIFNGVVPKVRRVLANRELRRQIQPALRLVYVDHTQIGSVLLNLIENAARHSPDRSEILVTMGSLREDGVDKVVVQVQDHGVDIPEAQRESVFTAFQGQENSYGNGLALAICKRIVEAHQGTIAVKGTEGGGSCFVFKLPILPNTILHTLEDNGTSNTGYRVVE